MFEARALVAPLLLGLAAQPASASNFSESSPWQFSTASEQASNLATVDMMERKKGGYYDGFTTVVYNTSVTNIGTQVNCNNTATAVGNQGSNSQAGNTLATSGDGTISADATGNSSAMQGDAGSETSGQENFGDQTSSVGSSSISVTTGSSSQGWTDNSILNDQTNSGNQTAGVNSSTACDMSGSTVAGTSNGAGSVDILNSGQ